MYTSDESVVRASANRSTPAIALQIAQCIMDVSTCSLSGTRRGTEVPRAPPRHPKKGMRSRVDDMQTHCAHPAPTAAALAETRSYVYHAYACSWSASFCIPLGSCTAFRSGCFSDVQVREWNGSWRRSKSHQLVLCDQRRRWQRIHLRRASRRDACSMRPDLGPQLGSNARSERLIRRVPRC